MYGLGQVRGRLVHVLAQDIRAGTLGLLWVALSLGAPHALTPGHGKAAPLAALLHAVSGFGLRC